jgi:hypothetical protein
MKVLQFLSLLVLISLIALPSQAQDSFEEWRQQREAQFQQFKDERDAKFLKMLEEIWEEVEFMRPADAYEEPKLEDIPEAPERPRTAAERPGSPVIIDVDLEFDDSDLDTAPIELPDDDGVRFDAPPGAEMGTLNFYELPVNYFYFSELSVRLNGMPSQESIMDFWADMSQTDYEPFLEQLQQMKQELQLNDWGYLAKVHQLSEDIYRSSGNSSILFTCYMMTKSDYQVKLGYSGANVYLLLPAENKIFNTPFYTIDGKRHYALSLDGTTHNPQRMYTYKGSYPDADQLMSLYIPAQPKVSSNYLERELSFRWGDDVYSFTVPVNRNLIAFYEFYPHTDLDVYHNAQRSERTRRVLLQNLASIIEGKDQVEAANILMRFTQTAFKYKTDTEQFGRQKYMLPEETIYYPYSDCDDRAIMLAFLVEELLGLEVVGLLYPQHLATAIKFDNPPEGDTVLVDGRRFTVADPTYILADVGLTMPQFEGVAPEVITLN